jgi:hypothetical protein
VIERASRICQSVLKVRPYRSRLSEIFIIAANARAVGRSVITISWWYFIVQFTGWVASDIGFWGLLEMECRRDPWQFDAS